MKYKVTANNGFESGPMTPFEAFRYSYTLKALAMSA